MTETNDVINGLFEMLGAWAGWMNVYKLSVDKAVRGLYWPLSLFYTGWGLWNLYYYPSLGQPWSFFGALCMVSANIAWVCMAYKYRNAIIVEDTPH